MPDAVAVVIAIAVVVLEAVVEAVRVAEAVVPVVDTPVAAAVAEEGKRRSLFAKSRAAEMRPLFCCE